MMLCGEIGSGRTEILQAFFEYVTAHPSDTGYRPTVQIITDDRLISAGAVTSSEDSAEVPQ